MLHPACQFIQHILCVSLHVGLVFHPKQCFGLKYFILNSIIRVHKNCLNLKHHSQQMWLIHTDVFSIEVKPTTSLRIFSVVS